MPLCAITSITTPLASLSYGSEGIGETTLGLASLSSLGVALAVTHRLGRQQAVAAVRDTGNCTNTPAVKVDDVARVRHFLRGYVYNMLVALAVINAVCLDFQHGEARVSLMNQTALRAFATMSTTNAIAALFLSLQFSDALASIACSLDAVPAINKAANDINLGAVLATPYAWNFSAVLSFGMYSAAKFVASSSVPQGTSVEGGRYAPIILALHGSFVTLHCVFAISVFNQLETNILAIMKKPFS